MTRFALGVSFALAAALTTQVDVAEACGGCFVGDTDSTIVTGHRMALAVSLDQTVLWDQIQYDGDPAEFSWVLPVMPGARLEIATDAWFEVLDAGTSMVIGQPQQDCWSEGSGDYTTGDYTGGYYDAEGYDSSDDGSSFGCGCGSKSGRDVPTAELSSAANGAGTTSGGVGPSGAGGNGGMPPPPPDVTVVHEGTVGPYETVTLSADIPGVLNEWLDSHGYNVPSDVQPVIDAYVAEGFDFIAMRLVPGTRVRAMKPVRVISPGASMALPLRMVAAGTGAKTALTLFMISEGRYQTQNYVNVSVPFELLEWDFTSSSSNYSELRAEALAQNDGHVWLTSYAKRDVLFSPEKDNIAPMWDVSYTGSSYSATTLAEAYARQGLENAETDNVDCLATFGLAQGFPGVVVDTCDDMGNCTNAPPGQLAAHELACGPLDDLAVGLIGMHPGDVWITRLEAELPRAALGTDLLLEAADIQGTGENRLTAASYTGDPCSGVGAAAPQIGNPKPPRRLPPGGIATLVFAAAAAASMTRRLRWRGLRAARA